MSASGLLLFVCAGLLLSGGAILSGSTSWSLLRMSYYFWSTDLGVELASSVIVMAGAILCLPTCWLATLVPYHKKSIPLTATLMTLATASLMLLSLGVASLAPLSHALRDSAALNASMRRAMSHVSRDPAVRSAFSAMQIELKCCGVQSSTDWLEYRSGLPLSCCGRMWNGKVEHYFLLDQQISDLCSTPLYNTGCLQPALFELRNFINAITVLASAIIVVMAVTLFSGAYSLVLEVLESEEPRVKPLAVRIACLPSSLHLTRTNPLPYHTQAPPPPTQLAQAPPSLVHFAQQPPQTTLSHV